MLLEASSDSQASITNPAVETCLRKQQTVEKDVEDQSIA